MSTINDITVADSTIWCATDGGVFAYDLKTDEFKTFNNIDGLLSTKATAIASDEDNKIWIGLDNGLIQVLDSNSLTWESIFDFESHQINVLYALQDTLFIGLDIGLSLYLPEKREVKETYKQLGNDFQIEIPVTDILAVQDTLWVTTTEGVAMTSRHRSNLLDPSNWIDYEREESDKLENASGIVSYQNKIWVGCDAGVFQFDGTVWNKERGETIAGIIENGTDLFAYSTNSIFYYNGVSWRLIEPAIKQMNVLAFSLGQLWAGTKNGLEVYNSELSIWDDKTPNSIFSNLITDVYATSNGTIWVTSKDHGFFYLKDNEWIAPGSDEIPGPSSSSYYDILADQQGSIWLGSWGGGVKKYNPSDNSWQAYYPSNNHLAGISNYPDYCVVHHMAEGDDGTIWLVNREAVTNQCIVAVSNDTVWTYYDKSDGIETIYLSDVTVDAWGRVWVGSDPVSSNGIYRIDPANTPDDKSDDPSSFHLSKTDDGLSTNHITALKADDEGGVWIGTPDGLYYYYNTYLERQYGLYSDYVNDIEIDGVGNVWIATVQGVAMLEKESYQWTYLTTDNSYLVSDNVFSISASQQSGTVYLCTSNGISVVSTPFAKPVDTEENLQLNIYPNPFNSHVTSYVTIDNLSDNVTVDIFNAAGYLVRHFKNEDVSGRILRWDGKNGSGNLVASGIYLVVAYQEDGYKIMEKFAFIH